MTAFCNALYGRHADTDTGMNFWQAALNVTNSNGRSGNEVRDNEVRDNPHHIRKLDRRDNGRPLPWSCFNPAGIYGFYSVTDGEVEVKMFHMKQSGVGDG